MRRRIKFISVILLLAAVCIWCASRWDAWFHNPEEAPYEPSAVPTRVLLTFGDEDGMHSRNISWMCGKEVKEASVELQDMEEGTNDWIDATGEVFESRSGKAAYYVARLRDLQSGHFYRYRAWTNNEASEWHVFFVQDTANNNTSFLYMGDIQDTIGGIANKLLKRAFRCNPDAEFFVCGGDLTERPTDAYWGETFATLDSIGQSVPVLTVTGNHDYLKNIICTLERRFSLIHSYFLDSMVDENQVFTVCYKDMQLFCLDSNREFPYLWAQRKWLEEKLSASTAKWKIVVLHHPLYSVRSEHNNIIQRWMFDYLIREHGVALVLQGHEHAYARTPSPRPGHAHEPLYLISHCSPKGYRIDPPEGRFEKIVKDIRTYQVVRTHGDSLFITAFNAENNTLIDSICITQ